MMTPERLNLLREIATGKRLDVRPAASIDEVLTGLQDALDALQERDAEILRLTAHRDAALAALRLMVDVTRNDNRGLAAARKLADALLDEMPEDPSDAD